MVSRRDQDLLSSWVLLSCYKCIIYIVTNINKLFYETRITASILKQDPNTSTIKSNANLYDNTKCMNFWSKLFFKQQNNSEK